MKASSLIFEAWVSISANRLRSFLAMLGIVIGVSSVVLMLAIGTGSRKAVEESINKLGTNLLIVSPGSRKSRGIQSNEFSSFTVKDAIILSTLPSVADAAAYTERRPIPVKSSFANWNSNVIGTTEAGIRIQNWKMLAGQDFSTDDINQGNRVVVIGSSVAEKLFPNTNPLGANIQINAIAFRVVGVLDAKGQSMDGRDQDNIIFMPISTAKSKIWGAGYLQGIVQVLYVQAISKSLLPQATEEIRSMMRERLKLKSTRKDTFTVRDLSAVAKVASDTTRAMSILLGSIASISLVVGGIGIMNIMLVTVSERTREIGIRKAIEANEDLILMQFLLEAVFIAGVGSLFGLIFGFGFGLLAEFYFGVPAYFSIWSVVLSLVVACGVGVASGLYPAYKAAKLQPIEALRVG